ncbi:MAG: hypothetical protein MUO67_25055, partial [Anaerolineales bacterium]|nr:hypothetical protein [Anaerolineales bacterium]
MNFQTFTMPINKGTWPGVECAYTSFKRYGGMIVFGDYPAEKFNFESSRKIFEKTSSISIKDIDISMFVDF